jgi:hypothetical protein
MPLILQVKSKLEVFINHPNSVESLRFPKRRQIDDRGSIVPARKSNLHDNPGQQDSIAWWHSKHPRYRSQSRSRRPFLRLQVCDMPQPYVVDRDAEESAGEVARDQLLSTGAPREDEATKATASSNLNSVLTPKGDDNILEKHISIPSNSAEVSKTDRAGSRITTLHESLDLQYAVNGSIEPDQGKTSNVWQGMYPTGITYCTTGKRTDMFFIAIPSASIIVRPASVTRATAPPSIPTSSNTTNIGVARSVPLAAPLGVHSQETELITGPSLHEKVGLSAREGRMVFGSGSRGPGGAHRRRNLANTNAITNEEADMTAIDRAKQKEAVARFLANNVRQDWTWEWPRLEASSSPDPTPEDLAQAIPTEEWRERDEWSENASEGAELDTIPITRPDSGIAEESTYRFDSPDSVGATIRRSQDDRKRRRRKRLEEEIAVNDGLRCFTERRDAWTGARHVSHFLTSKHTALQTCTTSASLSSEEDGSSTAIERDEESDWDDTQIPVAPPFIPPENAMRSSVTPSSYNMIFDKIVTNHMAPMCPINLKDITRSCVKGWQRDGTWEPPRVPTPLTPGGAKKLRKMSVSSLFSREGSRESESSRLAREDKHPKSTSPSGLRGKLGKMLHLRKDGE